MGPLAEKYRPGRFSDVLGQDKAVRVLSRFADQSSLGGRAYWIQGKSGTGKTTLAKIIADQVVNQDWDVREVVGRELTIGTLRDATDKWIYCGGHALIVNESHGMAKPVIEKLLDVLENLRQNVVVIFTTTNIGADLFEDTQLDAGPLASRCICLKLTDQGLCPVFAQRALEIARAEGLDGKPIKDYENLVKRNGNNMRAVLMAIESGEMLQ